MLVQLFSSSHNCVVFYQQHHNVISTLFQNYLCLYRKRCQWIRRLFGLGSPFVYTKMKQFDMNNRYLQVHLQHNETR
ncbi:unnamed protein product [Paramecium sonneborni]|uniref:Uncharacterized protein n=1 Tax=Paramecium sonneborni TaxID=65129 RepID=A0A8S1KHU7_9CILI|nr:unnamed protein product [Paramecium sonneborni]